MGKVRELDLKSLPLWLQLTAGMLTIMVLVALLGGEFVRGLQRQQLIETNREETLSILELLAAATLEAAITEDIPQLESIVAQVARTEQDIYRVQVTNEDAVTLVRWQRPRPVAESDLLTYDQPILLAGEAFGSLQVAMDMRRRYRAVDREVSGARLFSLALLVLLTVAMLLFIQLLVVRPMTRINHRVQNLAVGDYNGEPVVATSRDLSLLAGSVNALATALRQEEQHMRELFQARDAAEAASQAKTQFLSSMSHELRTPLNAILGFSQLLELDSDIPLSENQNDSVQEIIRAGNHLLQLINEVLDLARIESGRMAICMEQVDLVELVRECLTLMDTLAQQYDVLIDDYPDESPVFAVYADQIRVKQVLLNLLSNAIKYNQPKGEVRLLGPELHDGMVRLVVEDTGPGLDPKQQICIFEPFSRLDDSHQVEGTGIGLTITRRLLDMMGGRIGVNSEPGRGSRFWIELQPVDQPTAENTTAFAHPPEESGGRPLLLYIEDNPSNLRLMNQVLRKRPELHLITAHQGSLGVELARAHRPNLILLGLHLPDVHDLQVLEQLLEGADTRDIPVIVVSTDTQPDTIKRSREIGITDYFTMPLDLPRLLQCIDRTLQVTANDGVSL